MRRRWMACLLVCLAVTVGCLGGEEAPEDEAAAETDEPAEAEPASLEAPEWSLGDYWTWSTDQVGEVTYIVTGDAGGDWIVDTTNEEVAFFHARFPVSTLGEIRKADLAGSQPDTRVRFFDWPLEAGKTWTTTWDGVEREITVDRVEDGTAYLTAMQDGRAAVEYTYDSERGSFGELVYLDGNETETFAMQPEASGNGPPEPAVRWQLDDVVDTEGTFGAEPAGVGFGFHVPESATDLWMAFTVDCPSGSYHLSFGPREDPAAEGSSFQSSAPCPADVQVEGVVVEDPDPGDYRGGFTASSPEDEGTYSLLLYVRTLEEIEVGEG